MRAVVTEGHALAGAAALRVDQQLGVGSLVLPALDVRRPDARMDVALAHPDRELATRDALDPEPEVQVGQEQDLAVLGDRLDDGHRVARRAAVVGLGLHLGRRVHVGDDDGVGVLGLPGAQLLGR